MPARIRYLNRAKHRLNLDAALSFARVPFAAVRTVAPPFKISGDLLRHHEFLHSPSQRFAFPETEPEGLHR